MNFFNLILFFMLKEALLTKANDQSTIYSTIKNNSSLEAFSKNINKELKLSTDEIFLLRSVEIFNKNNTQQTLVKNNALVPKVEGAFCRRSYDGRGGYCILTYQCLHVMREHRIHGIKVDICTYRKNIPVICCPLEDKHAFKQRLSAEKCRQFHSALKDVQLSTPRILSGKQCVSSVPMIVGGQRTQKGAYPHMAAIGWTESDDHINWGCGGTLISVQYVLTAAHCATTNSKPPDIVRLGAQQLNETRRLKHDVEILIIILHPKYASSSYYNDIALVKLAKRTRFSENIRPACLWQQANIPTSTITATGWGRTEFMGPKSNDLLKVELDIFEQDICKAFYQTERRLSRGIIESQFCAGYIGGGKDTCQGDSGGPVHIELPDYNCVKFVVGITSFGKFCAAPNAPGVYTKIYKYLDWIEKVAF